MKDINEIILNKVRLRIIQELALKPCRTATELCEKISDVPRTTLYRHINILLDNRILSVVSEKKIRGSIERTLSLNIVEISRHNTLENASQNVFRFIMDKYANFHNYFSGENPNPGKDRLFFSNSILMMDDREFDQFAIELRELIIKYNFDFSDGRKARDISIISSPVIEKEKENKNESHGSSK